MSKSHVAFFIRGLHSIAGSVRRGAFNRTQAVEAVNQLLDNLENVDFSTMTAVVDKVVGTAFRERSFDPVKWDVEDGAIEEYAANPGTPRMDYEANRHACAYLMPEDEFRAVWTQRNGNVAEVATIFSVTESIARERASGLGLGHGHAHG